MATPESQEASGWRDTAERIFQNTGFTVVWVIFLGAFVGFVSWPIRYRVLVFWNYGRHGYFDEGVRVVPGRPLKFSTGELVPQSHDVATAFGAFFITAIGLTFLLIVMVRLYLRYVAQRGARVGRVH